CSHERASLADGWLEGCEIECPLHSSRFDLRTGAVDAPPARLPVRTQQVVIVGGSLAGISTARALRKQGYDGGLTIVGAEPHRPYDRPPLSKEFLGAGSGVEEPELSLEMPG